ncbi:hypothetical protein AB6A63_02475, partial ['Camptotheca acuminata' phytoplasma]
GARRTDVLKIFLTEGFVIFFLISCLLLICLTIPIDIVNWSGWTKNSIMNELVFQFIKIPTIISTKIGDIREKFEYWSNIGFIILIVTMMNLFITFISIFSPIWVFSRKKPMEIILDK